MSIILEKDVRIAGSVVAASSTPLSYTAELEADLVARGVARYAVAPAIVDPVTPSADYAAAVVGASGLSEATLPGIVRAVENLAVGDVRTFTAVLRHRLSTPAVNLPFGIRLRLPQGVAPAQACIRVRDETGAYVKWQYERCRHARTGADISTHGDGSIKSCTLFVVPPLIEAGGSLTYTVEVWPTAQTQSFPAEITFSAGAGYDEWDCAAVRVRFVDTWTKHPAYFLDKASNRNLFTNSTSGISFSFQNASSGAGGTTQSTGNTLAAAAQTLSSSGERDSSDFGYGVIYREFVVVSVGTTSPHSNLQTTAVYRLYTNGRLHCVAFQKALASLSSTDSKIGYGQIAPDVGVTGQINTFNNREIYYDVTYPDKGWTIMCRSIKAASDEDTTSAVPVQWPGGTGYQGAGPSRLRFGWSAANYVVPINAQRRVEFFVSPVAVTHEQTRLECWNMGLTTAAAYSDTETQIKRLAYEFSRVADRYMTYGSAVNDATAWHAAVMAGAWVTAGRIVSADMWSLVPALLDRWLGYDGRGPADSGLGARLYANYTGANAASGWEHVGRDLSPIHFIYQEAVRRGDQAVAAKALSILRGIADFAVLAEADSSGTGRVILNYYDSPVSSAAINGWIEPALALAIMESLGQETQAMRDALDRIWSAFNAEVNFGNWPAYAYTQTTTERSQIYNQVLFYFLRTSYVGYMVPVLTRRHTLAWDPVYSLIASVNAEGQTEDWRDGKRYDRRGMSAPLMGMASTLAVMGDVSDLECAIRMVQHVNDESDADEVSPYPLDGWANPTTQTTGDARAVAAAMSVVQRLT